jgi:hypothetical protein
MGEKIIDYIKNPESILDDNNIDIEIRKLCFLFNKYGLRTQFSCIGHELDVLGKKEKNRKSHIIFDDNITNDDISKLLNNIHLIERDKIIIAKDKYIEFPVDIGNFGSWIRILNNEAKTNQTWELTYNDNIDFRNKIIKKLEYCLTKLIELKNK